MLKLFNTLTKKKEEFKPLHDNEVGLYTCGPTVYNYAHLGNLRTYIFEDILKRTLIMNGYKVKHVMNITDVGHLTSDADEGEDKMEKSARREHKTVWEIAQYYTDAFKHNLHDLNIIEPDVWCKATDHIAEQIDWIKKLEEKNFTYRTSDGIYFDTNKFKHYGQLTGQKLDELKEGARVEKNPEKKNATDFALWKFSPQNKKRQMEWESPWGKGFPGWHIECSVMSQKYLGETIDIHCGGVDHIAIHHTNEIAQAEAVTGKPFVRYWLHGEFLVLNSYLAGSTAECEKCGTKNKITENDITENEGFSMKCLKCGAQLEESSKMSKSKENFITLAKIKEKGYSPPAFRYLALNTHYRKKMTFSWQALEAAQNTLDNLYTLTAQLGQPKIGCAEFELQFQNAINDDLNIPKALGVMRNMLKSDNPASAKKASLLKFDKVLGLNLALAKITPTSTLSTSPSTSTTSTSTVTTTTTTTPPPDSLLEEVENLRQKRDEARKNSDWATADKLRKIIEEKGFRVKDEKISK